MTDVRAGDLLNDRYEIIAPIGSGAFANTWRARDNRLGRIVAVKILRPDLAIDPAFAARFLREAQTAAVVTSDNTVQMFDVGIDGDRHWIAMEFVDGESLRDRLRREGGPLQVADARSIMLQILRGLDAIHLGGIIHRDLKPENVLIGSDGVVRIADFGIALMQDQVGLTSTGTTFGSAAYMAPEQGLGQRVTPATDLYAAGVVLFEMLTGRLPFATSTTVAMLLAHQNQAVPSLASINPALAQEIVLDGVVHQALRKRTRPSIPKWTIDGGGDESDGHGHNGSNAEKNCRANHPDRHSAIETDRRPASATNPIGSRGTSAGIWPCAHCHNHRP